MFESKVYNIEKPHFKILRTTQKNVVIPTEFLVKEKKADLRVLACVSAISNVTNNKIIGSNSRYCSIHKINNNLTLIAELINIKRSKVMHQIKTLASLNSQEFLLINEEGENRIDINYSQGGFITLSIEDFENLIGKLDNNAFKLYINLLWLCRDNKNKKYVERQFTQEFLLDLIGLSKTSKRLLKKAEDKLISLNLITVKTKWESSLKNDLTTGRVVTKKFYKITQK